MVEHALAKSWPSVTISGGTPEWRTVTARLATQSGLKVENPKLATVVESEQKKMRLEQAVARWRSARDAISWEPESSRLRKAFVAAIEALRSEPGWPALAKAPEQTLIDYDLMQLELRLTSMEGTRYRPDQFENFLSSRRARSDVRYE